MGTSVSPCRLSERIEGLHVRPEPDAKLPARVFVREALVRENDGAVILAVADDAP
jgi:hypothetical protein